MEFQCSSASRKFLNSTAPIPRSAALRVSVLFSEPKIPQFRRRNRRRRGGRRFQCSSASRKFLNSQRLVEQRLRAGGFSALQRAENSSIRTDDAQNLRCAGFQCSSASRKFLNQCVAQQRRRAIAAVSVLFSEPKIPQSDAHLGLCWRLDGFSALQRAENSSIRNSRAAATRALAFQCSSASRKFLNFIFRHWNDALSNGFSALQRAENSSIGEVARILLPASAFQCSSASRKFLNQLRYEDARSGE